MSSVFSQPFSCTPLKGEEEHRNVEAVYMTRSPAGYQTGSLSPGSQVNVVLLKPNSLSFLLKDKGAFFLLLQEA